MKKIAILVAAITLTVGINAKVFATGLQNVNSTSSPTNINESLTKSTGIMPDNLFYFFDKASDNLKLFITFDATKKTEILKQIADERLNESENMTQKEKYDLAKSTIEKFNNLITKASDNLTVTVEDNNTVNLEHKEAVTNMVEKRHILNAARQEYQLAKIDLKQVIKSGDETDIKAAQEVLKEKENLYKDAKEEFNTAFEEMKSIKNDVQKTDKKAVKNEVKTSKIEEAKDVNNEEVLIKQDDTDKVTKEVKVVSTKEKVSTQDDNIIINPKKVEDSKKVKEVKKEIKENRNENKKDEIKEIPSQNKENRKN